MSTTFPNTNFLEERSYGFGAIVTTKILPLTPICLCSVPGYNASYLVQSPVASTDSRCTSISMGSQEGYGVAVQAISTGI
ncbi:hypothetical protein BY996DRAFT_2864292 [Phakopsora pachyrhizi]|nr:hypothetical protein BY996DRAFT_2864292 [Phakopsora pachyrhizi]